MFRRRCPRPTARPPPRRIGREEAMYPYESPLPKQVPVRAVEQEQRKYAPQPDARYAPEQPAAHGSAQKPAGEVWQRLRQRDAAAQEIYASGDGTEGKYNRNAVCKRCFLLQPRPAREQQKQRDAAASAEQAVDRARNRTRRAVSKGIAAKRRRCLCCTPLRAAQSSDSPCTDPSRGPIRACRRGWR